MASKIMTPSGPISAAEEAGVNEIIRRVRVDRTLLPMWVIDATGRIKHVDEKIVATMPKGEGEEVDMVFFIPEPSEYTRPGYMSDEDFEKALNRRDLVPDPRGQSQVNEEDPAFADKRPNGVNWRDGNHFNCIAFGGYGDGTRFVNVHRSSGWWNGLWWKGIWWGAGARK